MEQKKWKFNVIDVIAVVLIVAAVALVGIKLMNRGDSALAETVKVTYQVKVEGVPAELYENCQAHLPSPLMASGELVGGQIESVEQQPYYVLGPDGQWVEDPEHVTLIFTATTDTPAGMGWAAQTPGALWGRARSSFTRPDRASAAQSR